MQNLRMKTLLRDAEYKALQAQINPHFFFNTLNHAAQLAMLEEAEESYTFIQQAAALFRSLKGWEYPVTLNDEVENVCTYAYILKARFKERIKFEFEIEQDALTLPVPGLILQPLVENAYIHGLEPVTYQGLLKVRVYREEGLTRVEVIDNGQGISRVGMVLVIVAGHIDLSVGSVAGFTGAVVAILQVWYHWGTVPAALATLAVGVVIGLWQAFWIAGIGVPAFIVTLSSMLVFRGGILFITKGVTISPLQKSLRFLGDGYVSPAISVALVAAALLIYIFLEIRSRQSRKSHGLELPSIYLQILKWAVVCAVASIMTWELVAYEGIPIPVLILLCLVVLFTYIANNTKFGRHVYAIGGNKEAAIFSGVNIKKTNTIIFVLMGVLSAIAGICINGTAKCSDDKRRDKL